MWTQKAQLKRTQKYYSDESYNLNRKVIHKRHKLKSRYGITLEDVYKQLDLQESRCANLACGVEISLTAPKELVKLAVVDHNHSTGKFRALLCRRCNTALGFLEKNPGLLEGLHDYLLRFSH